MQENDNLVRSLKTGNEAVFEAVFKQYFARLCVYASSIVKSDAVAEEIVEDLFLKLWENCDQIDIKTSVRAYLFKSVYNQCLKYIRHQKVEQKYAQSFINKSEEFENSSLSDYPIAHLISKEIEDEMNKAIDNLPDQCRECFCLHRFDELTYPEIAEKLGISVNTVKTQISRALQKLRLALKDFLPEIILFILFSSIFQSFNL